MKEIAFSKNVKTFCLIIATLFVGSSCAYRGIHRQEKSHDFDNKVIRAKALYQEGDYDAAVAVLQNALTATAYHITHDLAYELLITWLLQLNRHNEASIETQRLRANCPNSRLCYKLIQMINDEQLAKGTFDESLDDYDEYTQDANP